MEKKERGMKEEEDRRGGGCRMENSLLALAWLRIVFFL